MYAVTGITGKVGGTVAQTLLATGKKVRAVVRDEARGRPWADKGCEVAIASIGDADALTAAFAGADGVFLMTPPDYDPEPGFPQTQANAIAIEKAIVAARPDKVVFLSTVGAQVAEPNLLNNSKMTEERLRQTVWCQAFCNRLTTSFRWWRRPAGRTMRSSRAVDVSEMEFNGDGE